MIEEKKLQQLSKNELIDIIEEQDKELHREKQLSEYSVKELSRISKSGKAQEYFIVGQEMTIELKDKKMVRIAVAAFDHYNDRNGKPCGITFVCLDPIGRGPINTNHTNKTGWKDCEMRKYLNHALLKEFPDEWQKAMRYTQYETLPNEADMNKLGTTRDALTVNDPTHTNRSWVHDLCMYNFVEDKLFLPSISEIYGNSTENYKDCFWNPITSGQVLQEGKQIPYLSQHKETGFWHWTRTPNLKFEECWLYMYCYGMIGNNVVGDNVPVAPMFSI